MPQAPRVKQAGEALEVLLQQSGIAPALKIDIAFQPFGKGTRQVLAPSGAFPRIEPYPGFPNVVGSEEF